MDTGQRRSGTARSFLEARADFDAAWQAILLGLTEEQFEEWRQHAAFTAWKYAMWEAGCGCRHKRRTTVRGASAAPRSRPPVQPSTFYAMHKEMR
jgi:hypothetical protein